MKKFLVVLLISFASILSVSAQGSYWTSNFADLIFQSSTIESSKYDIDPGLRFSMWFHLGQHKHYDISKFFGLYSGYDVRNVGMVYKYETEQDDIKIKRRAYTIGIPIAIKLGKLPDSSFFYAGGEMELAFHYKQKLFKNGVKGAVETEWFSDRINLFQPSVFAGFQFKNGMNISAKWYLLDFFNEDYRGEDFNQDIDYSQYTSSQMFYISLSMHVRNGKLRQEASGSDEKFAVY